jgi:hypothetical protein
LVDQWTVRFLSGQNAKVDPGTFKTVEQAIQDHIDEKRGTLDRSKESTRFTIQKISGIPKPLAPFLHERGTVSMKDVKMEHLSAFQETWQGRLWKNRETGEFVRQPKSQLGVQKNQEFLKMFFRRARELRWVPENPAELLLSIKTPKIKKKLPERSSVFWMRYRACFRTSRKRSMAEFLSPAVQVRVNFKGTGHLSGRRASLQLLDRSQLYLFSELPSRQSQKSTPSFPFNNFRLLTVCLKFGDKSNPEVRDALAVAEALREQTKALATLSMHQNRIAGAFDRTLAQLRQVQAERRERERRELAEASRAYQNHAGKSKTPFIPAEYGFVLPIAQIELQAKRDRLVHNGWPTPISTPTAA